MAASEGTAVGMAHLVRATQREYQKIGRLLKAGGFGPYQELLKSGEKMV